MDALALLGPLEGEVMKIMWVKGDGTVRDVLNALRARRDLAYTSVMTIMNNLVTKGLLTRNPQGRAFVYSVALTREQFVQQRSQEEVGRILERYGDLAIARFLEATEALSPEDRARLQRLAEREERGRNREGDQQR